MLRKSWFFLGMAIVAMFGIGCAGKFSTSEKSDPIWETAQTKGMGAVFEEKGNLYVLEVSSSRGMHLASSKAEHHGRVAFAKYLQTLVSGDSESSGGVTLIGSRTYRQEFTKEGMVYVVRLVMTMPKPTN